jgi:hypothetical protein
MHTSKIKPRLIGLVALGALAAGAAQGQPAPAPRAPVGAPVPPSGIVDHITIETPGAAHAIPATPPAPAMNRPAPEPARPSAESIAAQCCVMRAGTMVAVQLVGPLSTHEVKTGDAFALRLAAPVIVDGQVVLPMGAPVVGRVVQAAKPGLGGKGAKLVVSADYVQTPGGNVPLQGLKLAGKGEDRSAAANVAGVASIAFAPLTILGFAIQGGNIEIPAGTIATARIAKTADLTPLAPATARDFDAVRALLASTDPTRGWIEVAPPPRGMGQVVFFRPKTAMGTGQWFNVRENDAALGKLTNGDYFVVALPPGEHHFTASTEPEFKDRLVLKVDPGETYFVEGQLTKGLVIGAANLTPSDKARFDAMSKDLEPEPVKEASASSR